MSTNLLVSVLVTLVTNSVETFPQITIQDPSPRAPDGSIYAVYVSHGINDPNPKEKWITTNIVELTTLRFTYLTNKYEAHSERMITNWTTHFSLAPTQWIIKP